MPLMPGNKFGLLYLYQPHFTQQSGLFSTIMLNKDITAQFLNTIPKKYRLIEFNLNTFNKLDPENSFYNKLRTTYQIDLTGDHSYLTLATPIPIVLDTDGEPKVRDDCLIWVGTGGSISLRFIVNSIEFDSDQNASIVAVDEAQGLFAA